MQLINDYCAAIKINFPCHKLSPFKELNLIILMRFAKGIESDKIYRSGVLYFIVAGHRRPSRVALHFAHDENS